MASRMDQAMREDRERGREEEKRERRGERAKMEGQASKERACGQNGRVL